jgi:hypothetical protein
VHVQEAGDVAFGILQVAGRVQGRVGQKQEVPLGSHPEDTGERRFENKTLIKWVSSQSRYLFRRKENFYHRPFV